MFLHVGGSNLEEELLRRTAGYRRRRGHGLQLVQRSQHALPARLVLLCLNRNREVEIKLQDVVAQAPATLR
jgi:hypothetical protein